VKSSALERWGEELSLGEMGWLGSALERWGEELSLGEMG